MKSYFIYENFEILSLILIGCPKKNRENCPTEAYDQRNKETRIKI